MTADAAKCTRLMGDDCRLRETVQFLNTPVEPQRETIARPEGDETRRQELEEAYRILVDSSLQGLLLIQEGRIVFANRTAASLTGYPVEELRTTTLEQIITFIHPEDRAMVRQRHTDRLQGRPVPAHYEFRAARPDGGLRWVEIHASLVEYRGRLATQVALVDITEAKQMEGALRESEERYRAVMEGSPVGMVLTSRNFEFFQANPAFCRMLGYTPEEMMGKTFLEVTHPGHRTADRENVERLWQGQIPCYRTDKRYLAQNGEVRWGSLSASLIRDRDGKPLYALAIVEDITERKQAAERLRAREQQLRTLASELTLAEERERRRIAAELHDHACQDLVLARMGLQTLLTGTAPGRDAELREIDATLQRILENVRELTFHLSSPTLHKFGLAAALEELLGDKFRGQKDVEYTFSNDPQPKPLSDDVRVVLFQSVREILINVLKHARARKVDLDIRRVGDSIRVAVTDDGVGFDRDDVLSLPARHHGFGLFSIKERLDGIGGALDIDSQPGAGSRFVLVAPLKRDDCDSGRKHDGSQDSAGG